MARADFKPDMINIAVDTNGGGLAGKERITLAQLDAVLSNRFRLDTNLPVYISGDAATPATARCAMSWRPCAVSACKKWPSWSTAQPTGPANENPLPHRPQDGPPGNHSAD